MLAPDILMNLHNRMTIRGLLSHNSLLQYVDNFRIEFFRDGDATGLRKQLGQFFTPIEIAQQIASLVELPFDKIRVLDPGAGAGMLSAAIVAHALSSDDSRVNEIEIVAYEIDKAISPYLRSTYEMCAELCRRRKVKLTFQIHEADFLYSVAPYLYSMKRFDLAIMNPPYRKIRSGSAEWKLLRKHRLPHTNLYAAFMTMAAILLNQDGQLLSISPRSFCNGPYFLPFRKSLLSLMSIKHVHLYNSRSMSFVGDGVLQENIIVSAKKNRDIGKVVITSCDDPLDHDITVQEIEVDELVRRRDRSLVIHLARNRNEQLITRLIQGMNCNLQNLNINVSTGRVVDFRARELLRTPYDLGSVPLLLPSHLHNGLVSWPIKNSKKLSAIDGDGAGEKLLVPNDCYVLVKRFTAKEQKRRLNAAMLDPALLGYKEIGIENHLNYFHRNGSGLPITLAKGLTAYLNSTIVDQYFRMFSGHTQVNATDLRNLKYPDQSILVRLGQRIDTEFPNQQELDRIVVEELGMQEDATSLHSQEKIEQSLDILRAIGVPRAQQNSRSALTLLSLLDLKPGDEWAEASSPLRRITEMMDFFSTYYGITYAPNTRETVRRQTIHQFWQMGIVIHNPDEPNRPINSPNYCYQVADSFLKLVQTYETQAWDEALTLFRIVAGGTLEALSARNRSMKQIPVKLPDGTLVRLSAGGQNELIKRIVEDFCPRFAEGGEVLYLGDAGEKLSETQINRFQELDIHLDRHGKTPDVVVYRKQDGWLILIEAVTSHGPIDQKRQNELRELFSTDSAGLIFVTAFESRRAMTRYLADISWETEVWIADAPDHLIHFDGERFLGPYL